MKQFNGVFPISNEDTNALPVRDFDSAIAFYETVMGFTLIARDSTTAVLKREDAQIGLIRDVEHKPEQAGSCYFPVNDVDTLRSELEGKGGDIGEIRIDHYSGKRYRVFFLREADNGYCFCFGQSV